MKKIILKLNNIKIFTYSTKSTFNTSLLPTKPILFFYSVFCLCLSLFYKLQSISIKVLQIFPKFSKHLFYSFIKDHLLKL